MNPLPYTQIWLGVAAAVLGLGVWRQRPVWIVVGTVAAVPACLLLSLLFVATPPIAVLAITITNGLSAWASRRRKRLAAALLLVPFGGFVVAAALRVPFGIGGQLATDASLGDLDLDGDLDVVLAVGRHTPMANLILLNDGSGSFERREFGDVAEQSFSVALGDLDGDGDLDAAIGNDSHAPGRVYLNDGEAHFTVASSFGEADWNSRVVLLSDLDGDERPDLVVANRDMPNHPGGTYVCMNDGRGTFPLCNPLWQESASSIAAGDLTGDGATDLVVPHADRGQSHVFINDGGGRFDRRLAFGPAVVSAIGVAVGDLDSDGALDIVMGDAAARAFFFRNSGGGVFVEGVPLGEPGDRMFSVCTADLNRDGETDVVLGMLGMPSAILLNDGQGRSFTRLRLGVGGGVFSGVTEHGVTHGLAAADLNGDGFPDVVAARSLAPAAVYLSSPDAPLRPGKTTDLPWHRLITARGRDHGYPRASPHPRYER